MGALFPEEPDLSKPQGLDEAEFANHFYKRDWVFTEYQFDRVSMFKEKVFNLPVPKTGYILMLGTHNCEVFQTWCDNWGKDRCLGFELYNEAKHPNVVSIDVRGLGDWCTTPIALVWNDIGAWQRTPDARYIAYKWVRKNTVKNGFVIERNNDIAKWNLSEDMKKHGFNKVDELLGGAYILYQKTGFTEFAVVQQET